MCCDSCYILAQLPLVLYTPLNNIHEYTCWACCALRNNDHRTVRAYHMPSAYSNSGQLVSEPDISVHLLHTFHHRPPAKYQTAM